MAQTRSSTHMESRIHQPGAAFKTRDRFSPRSSTSHKGTIRLVGWEFNITPTKELTTKEYYPFLGSIVLAIMEINEMFC